MQLSEKHRAVLKKVWKVAWQSVVIGFITLLIFEAVYRFYWVDFYRTEMNALNPKEDLELTKDQTILIFGDSFTADPQSWVKVLRDSLPAHNIINCALPGTSVFHQKLFFEDRIEEFEPDQIIVQLYVGNDLIDYDRPQNFGTLSLTRNLYWWFSDYFISLQYLNYKLGQFKASGKHGDPKEHGAFDPDKYNVRVKNYITAYPEIIQESINPKEGFLGTLEHLKEDLSELLETSSVPVTIVLVPHCAQTNDLYLQNYKDLGATLTLQDFGFYSKIKQLEENHSNLNVCTPLNYFIDSEELLYFENDPHLKPIGQIALGEFILKQLDQD